MAALSISLYWAKGPGIFKMEEFESTRIPTNSFTNRYSIANRGYWYFLWKKRVNLNKKNKGI